MKKIYLAGPLFTEYEQKQRTYEAQKLREYIESKGLDLEVFSPLETPVNGDVQPTQDVIFETDCVGIDQSKIFFFDLSNEDSGTMMEIGMAIQRIRAGEDDIQIYPVESDFRAMANSRLGLQSSWGGNSFIMGSFKRYGFEVFTSFDSALEAFKNKN